MLERPARALFFSLSARLRANTFGVEGIASVVTRLCPFGVG